MLPVILAQVLLVGGPAGLHALLFAILILGFYICIFILWKILWKKYSREIYLHAMLSAILFFGAFLSFGDISSQFSSQ